jgi:hypothetical protein
VQSCARLCKTSLGVADRLAMTPNHSAAQFDKRFGL